MDCWRSCGNTIGSGAKMDNFGMEPLLGLSPGGVTTASVSPLLPLTENIGNVVGLFKFETAGVTSTDGGMNTSSKKF